MTRRNTLLCAVVLAGIGLRALGIAWGLPDRVAAGEPPFHPDEFVPYVESARLYSDPRGTTFIWGGGFYMRLAWLARSLAEPLASGLGDTLGAAAPGARLSGYAATLLCLRLLNTLLALATACCAGIVARDLAGARVGLGAFALSLLFPGPVLDAHFARPDVLMSSACGACLALSLRAARSGAARALCGAGIACGVGCATMLSGLVGLAPLGWAALEMARRPGARHSSLPTRVLAHAAIALAGISIGYLVCNTEALLDPAAFQAGLGIAFSSHQGGAWAFPSRLLSYVPLHAFGVPGALAAAVGALWLAARGPAGSGVVLAHLIFGAVLLGRVGFDMMRHLEFVAAPIAAVAALGIAQCGGWIARASGASETRTAACLWGAVAIFTMQLSLGLVLPMQIDEDARYRAGRWLAENAPPGSRVGITSSFAGDQSYSPRLPIPADLRGEALPLRPEVDARGFLSRDLDFIATTDYARDRARGDSARRFQRELFEEGRYSRVFSAAPSFGPPLLLTDLLTDRKPADLSYTRATFFVFQRKAAEAVRGGAASPVPETSKPRP